ncbi:MAG: [protein-PII] uridylyltransferase [Micromonosporaceae bacterium]|nr:[protein-PII] uridylyltransferase [Micromonosporaceae bacterium]
MVGREDIGEAVRSQRADTLDAWLATLLPPGIGAGMALVAVGGLGRRECAPYGDLDLVLLHGGEQTSERADEVGTALWYAIWDAKYSLDHSTRSVEQALAVGEQDLKAELGMLDARMVAGDGELFSQFRSQVLCRWRADARRRLPALAALTHRRWERYGELAFLLEGDIKESRGGLRDFGVLRGIGYAGVADAVRPAVSAAHRLLLDVRDALHAVRGRRIERLHAQDRDDVAAALGYADGDAVLRSIAEAARTTANAADDALRAAARWAGAGTRRTQPGMQRGVERPSGRRPIGRDVVEHNGEAMLARVAITPRPEDCLALRVAAAAARADLPIARATLEWLAAFAPPLPDPWPDSARDALFTLLGSGRPLIETWEACDRYGLVTAWMPELARVRSLPQHNPVHQFTVDRHMVEATCRAAELTREVSRPDLLLLSALLHDIGKGLPGDHSVVGAPIAATIAQRIGLPPQDVEVVERAVRLHLLLPEIATRRDLGDPSTIATVTSAVHDRSTLAILHALARADAAATGPAAWSTWKGRLIADLVRRADRALGTGVICEPARPTHECVDWASLPVIMIEADRVKVVARDAPGLLASIAGCLAVHRLDVVAANASTSDGIAVVTCAVQSRFGRVAEWGPLTADLRRALRGDLDIAARLAARTRSQGQGARWLRPQGQGPQGQGQGPQGTRQQAGPRILWQPATGATILELRAADSAGLLYRVTRALGEAGAVVRAARISTLGADVVDAFYLVGEAGWWADPDRRRTIEQAVVAAAVDASASSAATLAEASTRRVQ